MKTKIRSNSFAAQLTAAQRDELFDALHGGLSYTEAAVRIHHWMTSNRLAARPGARPRREIALSEPTTIAKWYKSAVTLRRYAAAEAAACAARLHCPPDYEAQTRRALDQARYLAAHERLSIAEIATLEKIDIARDQLALAREKAAWDAYEQHVDVVINRARHLAQRAQAGGKSAALDREIAHALAEIEQLRSPSTPDPGR
ncbi:MAG: hypothetical protein JSS11_03560 [Verrucomicrobia bacterium]|nr:hypothetical protein [Verrucomicrobiota bacterium]